MWARVDRALNGVKQHGTRGGTDTSPRKWALRRECLARMWARPRQGTLRFVIWGPSADVLALPGLGAPPRPPAGYSGPKPTIPWSPSRQPVAADRGHGRLCN